MNDERGKEEADVSWSANPKDGEDGGIERPRKGSGDVILESMLFKDDAKEIGVVEVSKKMMKTTQQRRTGTRNHQYGLLRSRSLDREDGEAIVSELSVFSRRKSLVLVRWWKRRTNHVALCRIIPASTL